MLSKWMYVLCRLLFSGGVPGFACNVAGIPEKRCHDKRSFAACSFSHGQSVAHNNTLADYVHALRNISPCKRVLQGFHHSVPCVEADRLLSMDFDEALNKILEASRAPLLSVVCVCVLTMSPTAYVSVPPKDAMQMPTATFRSAAFAFSV